MKIFRKVNPYRFYLLLIIILAKPICVSADEAILSQSELVILGQKYSVNQEYEKVAEAYERLLKLYPDTRDEGVYRELADVYETRLLLFEDALNIYNRYLKLFPHGRLRKQFQEKADYLERQRNNWDILKQYRFIQKTYYDRPSDENIRMMKDLLKDNPNIALYPDVYCWLGWEYHNMGKLKDAQYYVEEYIDTFPENGKSVRDEISAYEQYVVLLTDRHKYSKAFNILDMVYEKHPTEFTNYGKKISTVRKERILWWGGFISYGYIILAVFTILLLRPWREKNFNLKLKYIISGSVLITIFTIIPMFIVRHLRYGIFYSFPTLAVTGSVTLFLINLLSPLSNKYSRRVYVILSIFLVLVILYVSFYKWDNLSIFYTRLGD